MFDSPSSTTADRRVELRTHARRRLAHAVEEDAVDAGATDHHRELRRVVALLPRAAFPGVVLHEHADTAVVERAHDSRQARNLFVEVELIAFVDADERIGVPEHDRVVATEPASASRKRSTVKVWRA